VADDAAKKPVTITRDDLYTQVWTTPMHRLGTQYGISGNGLAKIGRRLDIPYPPRGYWARKAAGKKVSQTQLPAMRQGTPAQEAETSRGTSRIGRTTLKPRSGAWSVKWHRRTSGSAEPGHLSVRCHRPFASDRS
jgi:hypothetical protein